MKIELTDKEVDLIEFGLNHLVLIYMSDGDKRLLKECKNINKLLDRFNPE